MVNNMHPHKHRFAVLGLSVLSLALLAGCAGMDDSDAQTTGKNKNPEAVLNASDNYPATCRPWRRRSATVSARRSA